MDEVERESIEIRALRVDNKNGGSDTEHMESIGFVGNNGGGGSGVKLLETGQFECFMVGGNSNVTCESSVHRVTRLTSNGILRDVMAVEFPPRPRRG